MARILLVEDNDNILELYERIFMQHDIVSASDAERAFKALENQHFDMVILDMHLPHISGMDVLRHLRHFPANKEVVVFAISSDDSLRFEAEDIGIDYWMTKPIDIEDLMLRASRYLG